MKISIHDAAIALRIALANRGLPYVVKRFYGKSAYLEGVRGGPTVQITMLPDERIDVLVRGLPPREAGFAWAASNTDIEAIAATVARESSPWDRGRLEARSQR